MHETTSTELTPHQHTLLKILARIDKVGDLPIFSASVNHIRMMSASEETEVMELATEIMKDVNLTAKLLRVANSPHYSRNNAKIAVPSRAVVTLGFNTVRNITLAIKVIDSFQFEHPRINMNALLTKSYLAAGFVREVAMKSGIKDAEETYTCGLLHNLGEIVVAVTLPDEYLKMTALVHQQKCAWEEAQRVILNTTLKHIAQDILKKWEFPTSVSQSAADYKKSSKGPLRNKQQLNNALACYGSYVMDCLYSPHTGGTLDYEHLMADIQEVSGLRAEHVTDCLTTSFKMSCDLAEQYGLDKKLLKPKIVGSDDDPRNRIARTFSYLASSAQEAKAESNTVRVDAEQATSVGSETYTVAAGPVPAPNIDPSALIGILHEITLLITQQADINAVFLKVIEGIQRTLNFDHAMLCLLTPDRARYKARFAVGQKAEPLKKLFTGEVNVKTDLFSRTCMSGDEVLVKNIHDEKWRHLLRPDFLQSTGVTSLVVAALRFGEKSLGFFYADMSVHKSEITPEQYRGFVQLVSQARLAVGIRNNAR